jgi:FtsZ-binding cell division protein ZapB
MPESDNLGNQILRFFIKDDEPASRPAPPTTSSSPTIALPNSPAPAAPLPPGSVDAKFAEHFANVLIKNNLPGPDYFEFREALRGLAGLGLGEDKQFQAAWASFKAMGGPTDATALTNTANQYLTLLAQDRTAFGQSVETAIKERVGGLQQEQQKLQADNEGLAKQLAEIQQKIAANTARLTAIGGEITDQSGKLNLNRQNYEATYSHFTQQIKDDISKIAQYLK